MSPEQCRAARGWLDWSQDDLARNSEAHLSEVQSFENGLTDASDSAVQRMRAALERTGVGFVFILGGKPCGLTFADDKQSLKQNENAS